MKAGCKLGKKKGRDFQSSSNKNNASLLSEYLGESSIHGLKYLRTKSG